MRIPIRHSRLAKWSRRLGGFALPLIVLTLVLRLLDVVEPDVFEICLALGSVLALAAVCLALGAYGRLWFTGDRGWGAASMGLGSGLAALVPAGIAGVLVVLYPATVDISTDPLTPPRLVAAEPGMEAPIDPATMLDTYPNLLGRSYRIEPAILHELAYGQTQRMGWQVLHSVEPTASTGEGRLNAARTSFLGGPGEIALRIDTGALGSQIHLRGASMREVIHDMGENGRALESFLLGLDLAVTQYITDHVVDEEAEDDLPEVIVDDLDPDALED